MTRLFKELETAEKAAKMAGEKLLGYFKTDFAVERKAHAEPVTVADRAAEAVIIAEIRGAFPDDGILSEEQADQRSWAGHARAWMIDPMDGTKEFIHGRPGFSVMIGLLHGARPVLGVVHDPIAKITYLASTDGGATMRLADGTETPLSVSNTEVLAKLRLVTSYSHRSPQIDHVKAALNIVDEFSLGSVGLKLGLIARGERDIYVNLEGHCKLWDVCAPEAILAAAGGKMTDLQGRHFDYRDLEHIRLPAGILATNGVCHDAVLAKLGELCPELISH